MNKLIAFLILFSFSQSLFAAEVLKVKVSDEVSYITSINSSKKGSIKLCDSGNCSFSFSFDEQALEKFYFKYLKARRALKETEALKGRFESWLFDQDPKEILSDEIRIVNAFESLVVFLPYSIRNSFLVKMKGVISNHSYSLHIDLYRSNVSVDIEGKIEEVYILEDFGYKALKRYHRNKKDLRFMRSFESYRDYLKFHIGLIQGEL